MKIEINDKKKIIEQHKNDLNHYNNFVKFIRDNLEGSVKHKQTSIPNNSKYFFDEIQDSQNITIIKLIPSFADKEQALYKIGIELYDTKQIDPEKIELVARDKLKDCVGLEKITIDTY